MPDYSFYSFRYQGCAISAEDWPQYSARAVDTLRRYKRMYTVVAPEDTSEAMAVCAMADVIAAISAAQSGTGAVASASIGSVSVSYNAASGIDLSAKGQAKELYDAARQYLSIYRG